MKRAAPQIRVMVEEKDDRSRWAWDTAPTDGSYPGLVYIGDMEDWSPEETKKRRDTFRDPWGGVWTEPLRNGATKAKWGTRTFDSGRYRCCDDLHDCGVFVSVAQGEKIQWHFKRQWGYGGVNNSQAHNQYECKNESKYKGPSRFHNIVVNELHNHFRRTFMLGNESIAEIRKEPKCNARPKDGEPFVFEPDIYLKLTNESWYTIEVIDTHTPERRVHEYCGLGLIEINLKELDCYGNDREFSKWVQGGGVQKILDFEFNSMQRRRRWGARDKKWKGKDERDLRVLEGHISKCKKAYGFDLDFDLESTSIEQVTLAFQDEVAKREQIKKAERNRELEVKKARVKLLTEIYNAVQRNIEKYGERIPRATNTYSSPDEVDRIYNEHFTKKAEDEKRKVEDEKRTADMEKRHREIQAEVARCEELYGFTIDSLNFLNLAGPEAVEPYFEKKKARIKAGEKARQAVEAKANEWRQVGYPQAIAQLEKEFGVTEEEVGCDSDFSLKEIREGFEWLAQDRKKEEAKRAKREAGDKMKLEQRARSRAPFQENQKPKDRSEKQVPLTTRLPDPRVSDDSVWDALQEQKKADRYWRDLNSKLEEEERKVEKRILKQENEAPKEENEAPKQARKPRKQERKRASKDITPEEEKKGYIKRLKKLQKEVHRTGLTARQSREAQDNLKRFVKANKGKYEDDES